MEREQNSPLISCPLVLYIHIVVFRLLHPQVIPEKKGNKDSIPKGKELDQTPGIHRDCSQHPTNGTWNDSQVFLQIQGIKNKLQLEFWGLNTTHF